METTTYGLDVAKRVFQLQWVDPATGEICNRKFGRIALISFLSTCPAGLVALEACASAHWWARKLQSFGHEVMLLHPRFTKPFVQNNKSDATDARAIWTAARQPGMRAVAVKTEEQQAMLALHRMRSNLIKSRTAQVNQLRGFLYEFGIVLRGGRQAGLQEVRTRMAEIEQALPTLLLEAVRDQLARLNRLDADLKGIECQIDAWHKQQQACQAIAEIPGVRRLTATALIAAVGNAASFKSGREFAAFLGLVPRHRGTGGKATLGHISKRGDPYLRTLLIHGARAALFTVKAAKSAWSQALLQRRPVNVAVVAQANKIARTVWAVLAYGRPYDPRYGRTAA